MDGSKQAMDIRIQELTDREVQQLTGLLSRRPSFGIGRPSKRWLEHQAKLVARLPPEIRRPNNLLKRFVIKYGGDRSIFEHPPAVLCPTHYEIHPRLMRRLFVVVLDEVTRHADRLRYWVSAAAAATTNSGTEEPNPEMVAFVDRVDGLGALWMEPALYLETFHAPPADRRMVKVESFCEACTLAVLGASARTLADIRAIIIDRAERLREHRDGRRYGEEEDRQRRQRRREERRERRRRQWEDEERMLEDARRDPSGERDRWVRSGRAPDAERAKYHVMLDEIEARHRGHQDREPGYHRHHRRRHQDSSTRRSSRGRSRAGSRHRHQEPRHRDSRDRARDQPRDPRLLRIVEIWIDHLGDERAAVARGMSDDLLVLLRRYRRQIDRARPREGRRRSRRNGIPVAGAAPATNPQDAAELRRKTANFYRNAGAARSVYRPDSLAGGMSQVGAIGLDAMPPPPMCGSGRPGAPEPPRDGRFSGFSSNSPPSAEFLRRFEREVQIGDGGGQGQAGEGDPHGGEDYDYDYDVDLDEAEELEEEEDEDDAFDDAGGFHGAEAERDFEREERSREKVAAWAVNAWAESRRDLSGPELERGARSVIAGMHPAFRPDNAANSQSGSNSSRRESAVPLPLCVGVDRNSPSTSMRASSIIGSALGIGSSGSSSSSKRRAGEEAKEREEKRKSKAKLQQPQRPTANTNIPYAESAVWTDITVKSDWRDHNQPDPPPPVPSMVAGIDPAQSTEAFPAYTDHAGNGGVSNGQEQQQQQQQERLQTPPPWAPAKKPSRKYCFPDSDIGSVVRGKVDRQYLKKNRGVLREVPPGMNPFTSPASPASKHRSVAGRGAGSDRGQENDAGGSHSGNPISPGANDDPWAPYERAAEAAAAAAAAAGGASSMAASDRLGTATATSKVSSRSTAPSSTLPPLEHLDEGGVVDDGNDDDVIVPDDSASNLQWARRAASDDLTQLGDFMGRR
ncbi:hypothetical protein SLS62_006260 [Diatrype stigma]|uniref:Uncharacterized protein n=1 Tax=Diatrype stigma TaxID=117547 RepID=A0AAN9YRS5_9PEZI